METPETIRISLQQGEWVTSLDFNDAYFQVPIHTRSRKYLKYKNPPVPRQLVDSSLHQRILPPGHPNPPRPLPGVGLDNEPSKIRVGTQTGVLWVSSTTSHMDWSNRPRTVGSQSCRKWGSF